MSGTVSSRGLIAHLARQSSGDAGVGSSWPAREIAQRRRGDPAVHVASRPGLWLVAWSCRRPMHKIHFLLATRGGGEGWAPPTGLSRQGVRRRQGGPSPLRKVSRSLPEAVEATGRPSGGFIFMPRDFEFGRLGQRTSFPFGISWWPIDVDDGGDKKPQTLTTNPPRPVRIPRT